MDLPSPLLDLFLAAGWYPGRSVDVPDVVPTTHPARQILGSFGGLSVGTVGAGLDCARSDIEFNYTDDNHEECSEWSALLRTKLICVGQTHNAHEITYVDSEGRWIGSSQIHPAVYLHGSAVTEALEGILLGRKPKPIRHPDQTEVWMYGQTISRGHPSLVEIDSLISPSGNSP